MSTHAGKMPKCGWPLISLHYSNPIIGHQKPKLPIASGNKTAFSLLETILIQFGMISIAALAAERSRPVPKHTATVGSGARAAQSRADLNMNAWLDWSPDWGGSNLNGVQWRVLLRVRLQAEFRGWTPVRSSSLLAGRRGVLSVMTVWPGRQEGECWSNVGRNTDTETKV